MLKGEVVSLISLFNHYLLQFFVFPTLAILYIFCWQRLMSVNIYWGKTDTQTRWEFGGGIWWVSKNTQFGGNALGWEIRCSTKYGKAEKWSWVYTSRCFCAVGPEATEEQYPQKCMPVSCNFVVCIWAEMEQWTLEKNSGVFCTLYFWFTEFTLCPPVSDTNVSCAHRTTFPREW